MNKKDMIIVGALVALLVFWGQIDKHVFSKFYPAAPTSDEIAQESPAAETVPAAPAGKDKPQAATAETPTQTVAPVAVESVPATPAVPAITHILDNGKVQFTASNVGASITHAKLLNFKINPYESDDPLDFDFSNRVSLAYAGLNGFSPSDAFEVSIVEEGKIVRFTRTNAEGLTLSRTLTLMENYEVLVRDEFSNKGGAAIKVEAHEVQVGPVFQLDSGYHAGVTVGYDVRLLADAEVKHVGKKIPKWIKSEAGQGINILFKEPVQWMAVKNKFFTHILTVNESDLEGANGYRVIAQGDAKGKQVLETAGGLSFPAFLLDQNQSYVRNLSYNVMPKKLDMLKAMPDQQSDIMQFPVLIKPISKILLNLLNFLNAHIPPHNYGVSIILLTILVRVGFWPLTHKGTESMKKMQALGPEMKELREKHKDNPQKQQAELMALYKREKINPLGGCLPMLVQMPVFIALFYVLRSAVELRFANFLWIKDLSEQEALFSGLMPMDVNILPFAMAGTMFVQQKLTPQTGDPQQQKIMAFFPLMLLVFMYSMPSGLLLYWTTSNILMIGQQVLNLKRQKKKEAAAA